MVAPSPRRTVRREMRRVVIGSVPRFDLSLVWSGSDSLDHRLGAVVAWAGAVGPEKLQGEFKFVL